MTKLIHICCVVGARPNFMKAAPLLLAIKRLMPSVKVSTVHTGQHYDPEMSDIFFKELGIPMPDFNLEVGSGTHAYQTAEVMKRFETVCEAIKPSLVIVFGDVNSTIACSLTAKKLGIKVAHVEAGLRSFDDTMPEEINRKCTDAISDYLFTTDKIAAANLKKEGVSSKKSFLVGNIMIDSLANHIKKAQSSDISTRFSLEKGQYILTTFHRPSNTDDTARFHEVMDALMKIQETRTVFFPIHPRTRKKVDAYLQNKSLKGLKITGPVSYTDMLSLTNNAYAVITDSGGIQEETTILGIPCFTIRDNTERPITLYEGTNKLIKDPKMLPKEIDLIVRNLSTPLKIPRYWDGKTAQRIVKVLKKEFSLR